MRNPEGAPRRTKSGGKDNSKLRWSRRPDIPTIELRALPGLAIRAHRNGLNDREVTANAIVEETVWKDSRRGVVKGVKVTPVAVRSMTNVFTNPNGGGKVGGGGTSEKSLRKAKKKEQRARSERSRQGKAKRKGLA